MALEPGAQHKPTPKKLFIFSFPFFCGVVSIEAATKPVALRTVSELYCSPEVTQGCRVQITQVDSLYYRRLTRRSSIWFGPNRPVIPENHGLEHLLLRVA